MIASAKGSCRHGLSDSTVEQFEKMLPDIERVASYRFRRFPAWKRRELVSNVVALAYLAFSRLAQQGKTALAYPTVLARYGIKQSLDGREVGVSQNSEDALSPFAQRRRGFTVELTADRQERGDWQELADDKRATPADVVAARLDFRSWLGGLKRFQRRVALCLARGNSTGEAAEHFGVSSARISQLRKELKARWTEFQTVPAAA